MAYIKTGKKMRMRAARPGRRAMLGRTRGVSFSGTGVYEAMGDACATANNQCYSGCTTTYNSDVANGSPTASDDYDTCTQNCSAAQSTCELASSSSGSSSSSSSGSSSSSSSGTSASSAAAGVGAFLSRIFGAPSSAYLPTSTIQPTTILLIGGAILGVVLLTRKGD
jgi:hypothetical protein